MSRAALAWGVLVGAVLSGAAASLMVGAADLADAELGPAVLQLRAWRLGCSLLAGSALAAGGVMVQGLFRNPLASPSILGTTAGASLGGVAALVAFELGLSGGALAALPAELVLPAGCLVGALGALALLLAVTGRRAGLVSVLLAGFILSSLFLSVGGLLVSVAQERWELGRAVVAFTLGSLEARGPRHVALAAPLVGLSLLAAWGWRRHLDALLSGEEEAASLGVDVRQARRWIIAWTAAATAAAVAIGGNIAFVGLVVPHALRPFVGVRHGALLLAATVGGAAFVTWADVLTRLVPAVGVVPLGVVTGLVGAPVFLSLLAREARLGRLA